MAAGSKVQGGRPPLWEKLPTSFREGLKGYQRMLSYARPYWPYLLVAAICLVLVSLLGLALPWVISNLVDTVVAGVSSEESNSAPLGIFALALAGLFALRSAFGFVQAYAIGYAGERVVARLRQELYDHLLRLSLGFFAEQPVGEILSRLTSDVQIIQNTVTREFVVLLQQLVTAVGIVIIVTIMDWRLTALMAVAIPGMVVLTRLMGRRIRDASRQVQDTLAEAAAVAEETAGGIRIVQSFAREVYEGERFGQKIDTLFQIAMQRTRTYATLGPLISFLLYASLALVLWVGGQEVLRGRLTPGELIAFLLYAAMLTGPLGNFSGLYGRTQQALGATERVFGLLDTDPEIVEAPDAQPLPQVTGHIIFHGVSFDYDPRQLVLREISLEVNPGEVVALIGPSGAGKTTFVNLVPRFYDPRLGHITIDGHDVRHVTLQSLRDQIGLVPQETILFSDTVAANIRYGKLDASQDEIEEAARAANAHEFISELPDGYETQVGERGIKLSGGQRQRIAIARAILKNAPILILDEATSSLDTESEQLVQGALERLMRPSGNERLRERTDLDKPRRTTFVIAHRLSTITTADRIVVLQQGRIVEQGTHQELLAHKDSLYRHYHALQFQWDEGDFADDIRQPGPLPSAEGESFEPTPGAFPNLGLLSPSDLGATFRQDTDEP